MTVQWCPEVESILTASVLSSVAARTTQYECAICHQRGDARNSPTNVLVYTRHRRIQAIHYAHNACGPSRVIHTREGPPSGSGAAKQDLYIAAWLVGHPVGQLHYRSCLVLDSQSPVTRLDEFGNQSDVLLDALLELGFDRIGGLLGPYPSVDEATVNLCSGRTGFIHDPESFGGVIIPALPELDPVWIATAHKSGTVDVIAGRFRLSTLAPSHHQNVVINTARTGYCIGAQLRVSR